MRVKDIKSKYLNIKVLYIFFICFAKKYQLVTNIILQHIVAKVIVKGNYSW